jgi:phage head maturation protease
LKSFVPPIEVQANARRALEVRSQKPPSERGMLEEGIARARDLANGRGITLDTIRRMHSFFARHEVDKQGSTWSTYGKGWQAWMGWGGDAGRRWARRILALHDKPSSATSSSSSKTGSTRSGTSFDKASPNANYNVQGGQTITGQLARDANGRFVNAQNVQQGAPPQGMPPQGQPQPQGMPPQGAPPQGAPPQGAPPQGASLQDVYRQFGSNLIQPLGYGRYRDLRTGQEFVIEQKVPKDNQKKQNEIDTVRYLESSGLNATRSMLEQIAIGATEGVTPDTRKRLHKAGLIEITPGGIQINRHGKRLLSVIGSNKDIASKEMLIKETLYTSELYRRNSDIKRQEAEEKARLKEEKSRSNSSYIPEYLQRKRRRFLSKFESEDYMNNTTIRKNESSYKDDIQGNEMALGQLRAISDKAKQLADMLDNRTFGLEAWQQSKITTASDEIGAVYDAVKYSDDNNDTEKMLTKNQKTFGGIPRERLSDDDFVFSSERKFPIVTNLDVKDAIASWGRYKGKKSFDEFKQSLIALVQSKGKKFYDELPDSWKEEMDGVTKMSNSQFFKFANFTKADPEQRIVVGYASSERVDGQNDVVDSEALNQALGDYMQWANLREMHQPKAVGKVLQATPVRGTIQLKDGSKLTNPLRITAQIIDNETWEKVKSGVLKGFSIGGKVLQALTEKMNGKEIRRITGLQLHEISLVDRPANPDARIVLLKREDAVPLPPEESMQKIDTDASITKAGISDPSKILPQLQQLRNQAEMDGDLEQAERYNEVISLMLEAMGIIPQGTTRDTEDVESGTVENANPINPTNNFGNNDNGMSPMGDDMGGNMMDMDSVYAYNPSFQQTSNVAYAQMPEDLQKAGRTISKATEGQLDQIMQAIQYITQQVMQLKQQAQTQPQMPPQDQQFGQPVTQGGADMQAVPTEEVPAPPEIPQPAVQQEVVPPQQPTSMAPSPETMAMLRGIGNPVLAANQQTGDLRKNAVDLASIEKEVMQMEQMTENSAPPAEAMEGTPEQTDVATTEETAVDAVVADVAKADATPADESSVEKVQTPNVIDVDAITKSLTGVIAAQLEGINKQIERIETASKEQHASLFETVNPLAEAVNNTKDAIAPLMEKMASLEPLVEKVDTLTQRIEALENTPVGNSPVIRGTAVNKALGASAASDTEGKSTPHDELNTLYKMIDETDNPLVRKQLRERAALLEAKKIFL